MPNTTWSPRRALLFARGLHHIASVDGFAKRERASIAAFMARVGVEGSVDALGAEPFDYAEAAEGLDSMWLRRTFVQACRLVVQVDGQVSPKERDALRAMASALGVGEAAALDDIEGPRPDPGRLVEWVDALAVDYVSWDNTRSSNYFWFFPHPDHPLAAGAELVVTHGQVLVVRDEDEGDFTDVLDAGLHRAGPETLPGLTARRGGWSEGRIAATLLYVRTAPSQILRWGTSFPAEVMSRRWGMIPIRAFGRFSVRFEDPQSVAARFARNEVPSDDEVEGRLRRMIAGRFAEALSRLDFADDAGLVAGLNDIDALTERILPDLKAALLRSGIKLIRFLIENLTGPLEVGLKPTSKRAESLNRLGRSLLGDPRDSGPVPTAAVPLVTRAVPSARAALASAEADAVVAPVGGDGAVAEARPVAVPIPSGPVAVPVARVASPEAVPVVRVAGQAVVEAPAQPGRHDTGGLKPIAVPVPVAVGVVEAAVEAAGDGVADGVACGSCRAPLPAGARFCMQCGTPQGLRCGSCGSGLPAGARFCSQCGARQG